MKSSVEPIRQKQYHVTIETQYATYAWKMAKAGHESTLPLKTMTTIIWIKLKHNLVLVQNIDKNHFLQDQNFIMHTNHFNASVVGKLHWESPQHTHNQDSQLDPGIHQPHSVELGVRLAHSRQFLPFKYKTKTNYSNKYWQSRKTTR